MATRETVIPMQEKLDDLNQLSATQEPTAEQLLTEETEGSVKKPFPALVKGANSLPVIITGAIIGIIIPVLQLVVGWYFRDQCSVNRKIPQYLIAAGAVGIIYAILNQFRNYRTKKNMLKDTPLADRKSSVAAIASTGSPLDSVITIIVSCLGIFMFGLFIAGCIWIFRVWSQVQYEVKDASTYCDPLLYRFAYVLVFLPIIFIGLCCCLPCCLGAVGMVAMAKQSR